ncbi:oxidoreductase [Erwinia pyrifoliae]|uniref:Oxidoreductase n=1 Tax=Erwinia pyrifoliae TaxID=79967 RepID=A0ABY5X3D5_ERWPY|nr:oxidoreductase [Erwinia pyrifoliae]UWS31906.1 oxidoreductase [Erwinia pyrifoliae]
MFIREEKLLKILYRPADYTHPTYITDNLLQKFISQDVLLNYWLISYYKLEDLPSLWQADDTMLLLVLTQWEHMPVTAHLVGGYLLRARLLSQCAVLMSDSRLLAFISLPLIPHISSLTLPRSVDTIALGVAFILSQIHPLPLALMRRLLMSFPTDIKLPQLHIERTLGHHNLLKMAINYAIHFK